MTVIAAGQRVGSLPGDGLQLERDFVCDEANVLDGGGRQYEVLGNLAGNDDASDRGLAGEVLLDPAHVSKNLAHDPVVSAGHLGLDHHVGIVAADRKNIDVALACGKLDTSEFAVLVFVELQTRFQKPEVPDQIVLKVPLKGERPRSQVVVLGGLLADLACRGDAVCSIPASKSALYKGGGSLSGSHKRNSRGLNLKNRSQPAPGLMWGACRRLGDRTDIPFKCIPTVLLLIFG